MTLIKIIMILIVDTFYQLMSKIIYYLPFVIKGHLIRGHLCNTKTVQKVNIDASVLGNKRNASL